MARDYVTIRELTDPSGQTVWTFTSVGHDRLKSAPAKVLRRDGRYEIIGVAWGAPVAVLEVSIDGGPFAAAERVEGGSHRPASGLTWSFWRYDWGSVPAGTHQITTRAIDMDGNVQPAPGDPFLAAKRTYRESNGQITRRVVIS